MTDERVERERTRMQQEYARRAREVAPDLYAPWQAAQILNETSRRRQASLLLHKLGVFPQPGDACLEVGCGPLGWLGDLLTWGLHTSDLHAVDVDEPRLARARETFPGADLRLADGAALPYADGTFRLVIASTLFTSILDDVVRARVAQEIVRVLAPSGALLWLDFAFNNPRNQAVRGIGERELRALFPTLHGVVEKSTLAPPIARRVAPHSWLLATALEALPFLRTHLLAVLVKPPLSTHS